MFLMAEIFDPLVFLTNIWADSSDSVYFILLLSLGVLFVWKIFRKIG